MGTTITTNKGDDPVLKLIRELLRDIHASQDDQIGLSRDQLKAIEEITKR